MFKRVTGYGSVQTLIHHSNHSHNAINRDSGSITVLKSFNWSLLHLIIVDWAGPWLPSPNQHYHQQGALGSHYNIWAIHLLPSEPQFRYWWNFGNPFFLSIPGIGEQSYQSYPIFLRLFPLPTSSLCSITLLRRNFLVNVGISSCFLPSSAWPQPHHSPPPNHTTWYNFSLTGWLPRWIPENGTPKKSLDSQTLFTSPPITNPFTPIKGKGQNIAYLPDSAGR